MLYWGACLFRCLHIWLCFGQINRIVYNFRINFCYLTQLIHLSKFLPYHVKFFILLFSCSFCRRDIIGAVSWGLLLCFLIISSYLAIYFRHFKLSAAIIFLGIVIPSFLHISRQRKLAKKRERRLLLPLSMWRFIGSKSFFLFLFLFSFSLVI